nr:glucoamylase [Quercus suber]
MYQVSLACAIAATLQCAFPKPALTNVCSTAVFNTTYCPNTGQHIVPRLEKRKAHSRTKRPQQAHGYRLELSHQPIVRQGSTTRVRYVLKDLKNTEYNAVARCNEWENARAAVRLDIRRRYYRNDQTKKVSNGSSMQPSIAPLHRGGLVVFLTFFLFLFYGLSQFSCPFHDLPAVEMKTYILSALTWTTLTGTVSAQSCQTTTLHSTTPDDGSEVVLSSYSYCGGVLNATVISLYYTNDEGKSTPLSIVNLGYDSSIPDTNYELWSTATPVWIDGIDTILNITYQAVDIGGSYVQQLNKAVVASGDAPPTLPSPPKPYATPQGLAGDMDTFLAASQTSEAGIALARMFQNINPAIDGDASGTVVAARSGPSYEQKDPDYEYNWVRDSSLTMDVVEMLYAAASDYEAKQQYENILFQYAAARAVQQNDPNLLTGLGEPKNDGPATAAITLIKFADDYMAAGGSLQTVRQGIYDSSTNSSAALQRDLLFVANNWTSPSFDLWEEESSDHFYTRLVQRRALVLGAAFATKMDDSETADKLSSAVTEISATFSDFWDPGRQILLYEYGPVLKDKSSYLDIAVILGVLHGYADDDFFAYTNDQVQSTALRIATSFIDIYAVANATSDADGLTLGIPVGRYPEDVYDGTGTQPHGGNPWYLCTAAMAQFLYGASAAYSDDGSITVTTTSASFFDYFAASAGLEAGQTYTRTSQEFADAISGLNGWGDAFMRTIKYYMPSDGRLAEEFNRHTGVPQGAADLTWSYASVLTAAMSRAVVKNQTSYVTDLANLGIKSN